MDTLAPDQPPGHFGGDLDPGDLARTGPDTLGGKFLRRFWTPVYRSEALAKGHAKPIRIMCEDFTLYRSESGAPRIVGPLPAPQHALEPGLGRGRGHPLRLSRLEIRRHRHPSG